MEEFESELREISNSLDDIKTDVGAVRTLMPDSARFRELEKRIDVLEGLVRAIPTSTSSWVGTLVACFIAALAALLVMKLF